MGSGYYCVGQFFLADSSALDVFQSCYFEVILSVTVLWNPQQVHTLSIICLICIICFLIFATLLIMRFFCLRFYSAGCFFILLVFANFCCFVLFDAFAPALGTFFELSTQSLRA